MVKIVNQEQLKKSMGQVIQIEGMTQRMKAGSIIQFEDIEIWCIGIDWEDSGRKVLVTGVLSRGQSPMSSFPIATQDESGGWSQGVQGAEAMRIANDELPSLILDSENSSISETTSTIVKTTPSADWLITVESHRWIK